MRKELQFLRCVRANENFFSLMFILRRRERVFAKHVDKLLHKVAFLRDLLIDLSTHICGYKHSFHPIPAMCYRNSFVIGSSCSKHIFILFFFIISDSPIPTNPPNFISHHFSYIFRMFG